MRYHDEMFSRNLMCELAKTALAACDKASSILTEVPTGGSF